MRNGIRTDNAVETCLSFFMKAVPDPTTKNFTTQLGCHFEEVHEHLLEIQPINWEAEHLHTKAKEAVHELAEYMKASGGFSVVPAQREAYLDALCDQMVTAIGCAHMSGMDIVNGFDEVNRSNLSKFDANGNPIFNENKKVMKSELYSPADLTSYV